MDKPKVHVALEQDREKVMSTVLLGFAADPLLRWIWPEAINYRQCMPVFDAFGGAAIGAGSAFVSENFKGAALWLPPGYSTDEEGLAEALGTTADTDSLEEAAQVFEAMGEYHPDEPCWYLPLIAVDPAHQGAGIGAELMKRSLASCDAAGLPSYLESTNPRNISLYERHGFEKMGEIQFGASPVITPMYRAARA